MCESEGESVTVSGMRAVGGVWVRVAARDGSLSYIFVKYTHQILFILTLRLLISIEITTAKVKATLSIGYNVNTLIKSILNNTKHDTMT